ncbi:hypothetical protein KY347_03130 [Candidatus Woesearchaeota archaeon]|nr:hypothetical protein [Candidatus Woesearchaeota archaeon]
MGNSLNKDNLVKISSNDAYYSTDFATLADDLADLAEELCPRCGNGIVENGEGCDYGSSNGDQCTPPYGGSCTYCSSSCEILGLIGGSCGDGSLDAGDEECDDGNIISGDGCSATCQFEGCRTDADCDDGLFCSGQETCNLYTHTCQSGIPVICTKGKFCNEATNSCELVARKKESDRRKIVHINLIAFDNEFVRSGDELHLYLNFENIGNFDLKDARITAIIRELGIRSNTLKSSTIGENEESSKHLILEIPKNAKPGRYWIEVVIDIDGDRRIKFRPIDIV